MATVQANQEAGVRLHVKALVAMTFVSLSSFQYGLDFGVIGGLQAMIGFLKVRSSLLYPIFLLGRVHLLTVGASGLRGTPLGSTTQVEHLVGAPAANLIPHGAGRLHLVLFGGLHVAVDRPPAVALDRLRARLRLDGHHAGHSRHRRALRRAPHPGAGEWVAHDACAALHHSELSPTHVEKVLD